MQKKAMKDSAPASLSLGSLDQLEYSAMDRDDSLSFQSSGGQGAGARAGGIDLD